MRHRFVVNLGADNYNPQVFQVQRLVVCILAPFTFKMTVVILSLIKGWLTAT